MKRKSVSLLLALTLVLSLLPAALAEESVTPTPPEWIRGEEYVIFEGGKVYEPAYWESLVRLRDSAQAGNVKIPSGSTLRQDYNKVIWLTHDPANDLAAIYEMGLYDLMYHKNAGHSVWMENNVFQDILLKHGEALDEETKAKIKLWSARYKFQHSYYGRYMEETAATWHPAEVSNLITEIYDVMTRNGITTFEEFLDCGTMNVVLGMDTYRWMAAFAGITLAEDGHISVLLDGQPLMLDVEPEIKNGRTMMPIRTVAEALGATVEWVQDAQQIVMTRAGVTVTMTLDSTTATIDGESVEMDVAPYATNGRTLIPARYVAEFFGQKVDWDGGKHQVLITEDKSVAGDSNLEAWALPMGAMLMKLQRGNLKRFGGYVRNASNVEDCLDRLNGNSWNIPDRDDLAYTVFSMTLSGHDATFREMAADVKLRSEKERSAISALSDAWPSYMWEYTEYLDEKWGDRGIVAWDLFRLSDLVQWGYTAGYVTYEEALTLLEPAAMVLCECFSSWDEAYENYLDGYNWWARIDVLGQDIWETDRGKAYRAMKDDPAAAAIFDDTLFETGVFSLPQE